MRITWNGAECTVVDGVTVKRLLEERGLDPRAVVVEHNRTIVPSEAYDRVALQEGEVLEVVHFVGGG
ncbi:MAG: sulfur carrier protein ThiS [Deltaproteobacteria bacterium]|nr:sulfur carrier protein ThiS [Deltaproteobacteria bacterium]